MVTAGKVNNAPLKAEGRQPNSSPMSTTFDAIVVGGGHIFHGETTLDQLYTTRPALGWARYRTPIKGLSCAARGHTQVVVSPARPAPMRAGKS